MPFCEECGALLGDGALFCEECGFRLMKVAIEDSLPEYDEDENILIQQTCFNEIEFCEKPSLDPKRDAYKEMFEHFRTTKEEFYQWGLKSIIYPKPELVQDSWNDLKKRAFDNGEIFIRAYGRKGYASVIFQDLYSKLLKNNHVQIDSTNNAQPTQLIQSLTGYKKGDSIINYQVSHIFGKTKNPFMFTAPWNICFTPKMIDPLTGHETQGPYPKEFQRLLKDNVFERYGKYIYEFNELMEKWCPADRVKEILDKVLSDHADIKMTSVQKDVALELSPINRD